MTPFKVTVKTLDGLDSVFDFEDQGTTVLALKEKIRDVLSHPVERQRLIFQGKLLQDDKTLSECGACDKVLHLVLRPPPGQTPSLPTPATGQAQSAESEEMTERLRASLSDVSQHIVSQLGDMSHLIDLDYNLNRDAPGVLGLALSISMLRMRQEHFNRMLTQSNELVTRLSNQQQMITTSVDSNNSESAATSSVATTSTSTETSGVTPPPPPAQVSSSTDENNHGIRHPPFSMQDMASMLEGYRGICTRSMPLIEEGERMLRAEYTRQRMAHPNLQHYRAMRAMIQREPSASTAAPQLTEADLAELQQLDSARWSQRFFNGLSRLMHLNAHMLHMLTDFAVGTQRPFRSTETDQAASSVAQPPQAETTAETQPVAQQPEAMQISNGESTENISEGVQTENMPAPAPVNLPEPSLVIQNGNYPVRLVVVDHSDTVINAHMRINVEMLRQDAQPSAPLASVEENATTPEETSTDSGQEEQPQEQQQSTTADNTLAPALARQIIETIVPIISLEGGVNIAPVSNHSAHAAAASLVSAHSTPLIMPNLRTLMSHAAPAAAAAANSAAAMMMPLFATVPPAIQVATQQQSTPVTATPASQQPQPPATTTAPPLEIRFLEQMLNFDGLREQIQSGAILGMASSQNPQTSQTTQSAGGGTRPTIDPANYIVMTPPQQRDARVGRVAFRDGLLRGSPVTVPSRDNANSTSTSNTVSSTTQTTGNGTGTQAPTPLSRIVDPFLHCGSRHMDNNLSLYPRMMTDTHYRMPGSRPVVYYTPPELFRANMPAPAATATGGQQQQQVPQHPPPAYEASAAATQQSGTPMETDSSVPQASWPLRSQVIMNPRNMELFGSMVVGPLNLEIGSLLQDDFAQMFRPPRSPTPEPILISPLRSPDVETIFLRDDSAASSSNGEVDVRDEDRVKTLQKTLDDKKRNMPNWKPRRDFVLGQGDDPLAANASAATRVPNPPSANDSSMETWHLTVPQNWIAIIEQDSRKETAAGPSSPDASDNQLHSEAYIMGMSSKRRKVVMDEQQLKATKPDVDLTDPKVRSVLDEFAQPPEAEEEER